MKKPWIVHVNRHVVLKNRKNGTKEPEIAVRHGKSGQAVYAHSVDILDKDQNTVATIARSDTPLSCGARIWIECYYGVQTHDDHV